MVVGRLLSSWESLFSGALLVFWGVHIYMSIYIYICIYIYISILQYTYICLCVCLCFLISPPPSAIFNHSPHRTILDSPMRVTMEAWRWGAKFHGSYMAMSIWFTAPSWERERFFFGDGMGAYLYIYIYKYIFVYSFIYLYIIIYLFIAWFIYLSIYCLNIRLYIYIHTHPKKKWRYHSLQIVQNAWSFLRHEKISANFRLVSCFRSSVKCDRLQTWKNHQQGALNGLVRS